MQNRYPKYQFDWLTKLSSPLDVEGHTEDFESFDMAIPAEYGVATMLSEKLSAGISLFHGKHQFTPAAVGVLIPLTKFHGVFPEPTFSIQLAYGGQFFHEESIPKKHVCFGPGLSLLRYGNEMDLTAYLDGTKDSEMIGISIPRSSLNIFLGEQDSNLMINALDLESPPSLRIHKTSASTSKIMLSAMNSNFTGKARKLYIQSQILEFFSSLYSQFSEINFFKKPSSIPKQIKDFVLAVDGKIVTLEDISNEFKMSARYLNQTFQKEFNTSIALFISNYRLEQSKLALENTDAPMKVISANLGYSHVNHFITAFKRKFGMTPGSLRK
jgi:AraC-like DNA-binding protein